MKDSRPRMKVTTDQRPSTIMAIPTRFLQAVGKSALCAAAYGTFDSVSDSFTHHLPFDLQAGHEGTTTGRSCLSRKMGLSIQDFYTGESPAFGKSGGLLELC